MEKENGILSQGKDIITEDGRKINGKSIKKLSVIGGPWTSGRLLKIDMPDVTSPKLVLGEPLEEWIKKPRTESSEIIYCSWMGAGKNVSLSYIEKQTESFDKLNIHPTSFFIDAGWTTKAGDWLSVDKQKFPDGLEPATKLLKEHHLKPGLWLAPLHAEESSELAKDHPDWFVQNHGKPISYWYKNTAFGEKHYLLDLRKKEAIDYLEEVAQKIKEWGFEWVKLDFMSSLYLIKGMSQKEKQYLTHKTMEIFKEKYLKILASGAPFNASVGVADAIRISSDSGTPGMPDSIKGKGINNYFVRHHLRGVKDNARLVGKFIKNIDPDMYYSTSVSEKDKQRLKEAQIKSVYRAGCLTLGDDFSKLSAKDAQLIRELINKFHRAQEVRPMAIKMFMAGQTDPKS